MDTSIASNPVPLALVAPFVLLLAAIALGPLWFSDWWGKHYPKVSAGLALFVVLCYAFGLHEIGHLLDTGSQYISFIALVGSLFVISGGIHITVKGEATPLANVIFLLVGAVAANLLGTTGASMLLIRPWLRMNKYRVTGHHVIFFIFIVSNVGGCLTPIGDPPLFLGYLMGVPFAWTAVHCLPMWATGVGLLLAMFFVVDYKNYARAPKEVRTDLTGHEQWRFQGLPNLFFLAVVLGAALINHPPFLREGLMLAAALASYYTTQKQVHESNHFSLHPIKEVAILFVGIFATMMPALDWLQANAGKLEHATPGFFYFSSGALSSVLDNAPTYLCFLKAIFGRYISPDSLHQLVELVRAGGANLSAVTGPRADEIRNTVLILKQYYGLGVNHCNLTTDQIQVAYLLGNLQLNAHLVAVSVGAVFFGANTYIGNGPNFMVKAIADHQKVHTPAFLTYILRYTLPFMLPMLIVVWWVFLR